MNTNSNRCTWLSTFVWIYIKLQNQLKKNDGSNFKKSKWQSILQLQVRFGDLGVAYFEVSDNGSGIEPVHYGEVVARHSTSKLNEFDDLDSIGTFGFRGEALAALAAISGMFGTEQILDKY